MPDHVSGEGAGSRVREPDEFSALDVPEGDVEAAIRAIRGHQQRGLEAVEAALKQLVERCLGHPPYDTSRMEDLRRLYEAAVRVSFSSKLAGEALNVLLFAPDLPGADERALSDALFFATAADRLGDLLDRLEGLQTGLADPQHRFARLLACAKASLVRNDPDGLRRFASMAASQERPDRERADRLARESYWLVAPSTAPRISQWRLRRLHHLVPREVAEWLEDTDLVSPRDEDAASSPAVRRILDEASDMLLDAARIAEDPYGRQSRLREALGAWALRVGRALADLDDALDGVAVPFTAAAWRLLELDLPESVVEAHARAVGAASARLDESEARTMAERVARAMPASDGQARLFIPCALAAWTGQRAQGGTTQGPAGELVNRLRAVAGERPQPRLETVVPAIAGRLAGIPEEVRQVIDRCLMDRTLLLPDEPPFRGRRWFECPQAYESYLEGREETDEVRAYKHFEDAWMTEPNNTVAIQGLIMGLRRRLRAKPGREHLLRQFASLLDQMDQREVEAALAYTVLAEVAEQANHQMERRRCLRLAVRVLQRRVELRPWVRARHAQIALLLELGDLAAAGRAAWEEADLHLPGTPASREYALLAATLWERASVDQPVDGDVEAAHRLAQSHAPNTLQAVQYAARRRHLVLLTDVRLDEEALEELWMECRGSEDEVYRFLDKQGTRSIDPRPQYLDFLRRKLVTVDAVDDQDGAARRRVAQLRRAAAEVLSRDPLQLASSAAALADPHMREFNATLRECAGLDQGAAGAFCAAVEEAMNALFMLRGAGQPAVPDQLVSCLGSASQSVGFVKRTAERFRDASVVEVARLMWRHLALALETPMREVYRSEKAKRLVPSQLGVRLHEWWTSLNAETGPLDLFHVHLMYRCPTGAEPMRWWNSREGYDRPPKDAVRDLVRRLALHAQRLDAIDEHFQRKRSRLPGPRGFGLRDEFDTCLRVLRAALAPAATPAEVCAVAGALERLGVSLRRIDMSRLNIPEVVYDPRLASDVYLLPRTEDLLGHLRQNVRGEPSLQVVLEVQDATGQDVLCVVSLDAGTRPVPATVSLRGLAPFADLVEAMGGQFHLWVARSGEPSGCRCDHEDGRDCDADEHVRRIEEQLGKLASARPGQLTRIEPWLKVLGGALRSNGSGAVAFALIPRVHE